MIVAEMPGAHAEEAEGTAPPHVVWCDVEACRQRMRRPLRRGIAGLVRAAAASRGTDAASTVSCFVGRRQESHLKRCRLAKERELTSGCAAQRSDGAHKAAEWREVTAVLRLVLALGFAGNDELQL